MAKLNHKIIGQGDPIIVLHGLFGMLDNWQTFAKQLAEDYMVILVDQRDHGKSGHTDSFSYPLLADDLMEFMEDNWIHHASILGHSMGGKTAMQFAANHEDMLDKLIVVDIAPKVYRPGHNEIFEALNAVPIGEIKSRKEVDDILSTYIEEAGVKLFLMKNLRRNKQGGFNWKMNLPLLHREYSKILANVDITSKVTVPSLFVRGTKSHYIDEDEQLDNYFEHAELINIEAGHWIHAEKPEELLTVVRAFLLKN